MGNCPDPEYSAVRWAFDHRLALARDWQLRFGMSGQYTRDMLVAGEQFGLGGADSVRGFEERAIADDRGYRGTLELHTPDAGGRTGWPGARLRALAFYDWGGVRRIGAVPPHPEAQRVGSAGLGLRLSRGTSLALRMDYGWVLDAGGAPGAGGAAGTFRARGDGRLHASFGYVF
jgi:hemolysin activation/secretion protein